MEFIWTITQYVSISILIGLCLMGAYDNFKSWRTGLKTKTQEKKCCD